MINFLIFLVVILCSMIIYNQVKNEVDDERTYAKSFLFITIAIILISIVAVMKG